MRAGRITISTRHFEVVDHPIPEAGYGHVRVAVKAAGVCLSDVHLLDSTLSPGYLDGDVVTMGHEVAGVVDQIGDGVDHWKIGDRVIVCAGIRDEKGRVRTQGFDFDGGFADFMIADAHTLVAIHEQLSFEQACIIPDAVSTPWAAITQTAQMRAGLSSAVFGIGGLGIHAVQLLKIIGSSPIIAVDPLPLARQRALLVGADVALDPHDPEFTKKVRAITNGRGIDSAFDFAGVNAVRVQALPLLAEGGKLIIIGIASEPITIPSDMAFVYKRNQILGHYGSEVHHTQELVELVRA
ncbi:MAG: zinc-binding dehydrogenase, partial [Actinobacteria bacterium]|nr:zinc-binding dehydrogenase [Actinomycetota bacterium]